MRNLVFHPIRTLRALGRTKEIVAGGGPRSVRVKRVGRPTGWILPVVESTIEIEARDGTVVELHPALPVPFAAAWAERLARGLNVPLVRDLDPEKIGFEVSLPGRG